MSYILDALKKSEFERQQGKVPDLSAMPVMIGSGRDDTLAPRLSYVLGALALAGVIAGVAWWRPWQGSAPEPPVAAGTGAAPAAPVPRPEPLPKPEEVLAARSAQVTGKGAQPEAAEPQALPRPAAVSPALPPAPKVAAARATAPETVAPARSPAPPKPARAAPAAGSVDDERAAAVAAQPPRKPAEPAARTKPAPAPAQPQDAEADMPAEAAAIPPAAPAPERPPKRVLNYSELPASVQKSIPKMTVMGYSYAEEPEMRMVVINDRMLREGDEVNPGVKLEKIGSDGIVLNFRGFRFHPQP